MLNGLRINPKNSDLYQKLKNNEALESLITFNDSCQGPAIMGASLMPEVGSFIAAVCGQVGHMTTKIESTLDKVEMSMKMEGQNISQLSGGMVNKAKGKVTSAAGQKAVSSTSKANSTASGDDDEQDSGGEEENENENEE